MFSVINWNFSPLSAQPKFYGRVPTNDPFIPDQKDIYYIIFLISIEYSINLVFISWTGFPNTATAMERLSDTQWGNWSKEASKKGKERSDAIVINCALVQISEREV